MRNGCADGESAVTAMKDVPARSARRRRPGAPVLPVVLRRPVAAIVLVCAAGFLATALPHVGMDGPGPLDERIDPMIRNLLDEHRFTLRRAVNIGSPRWLPVFLTTIVGAALLLRRPRTAAAALLGMALLVLAVTILQPSIGRTLDGAPALPSGHTAGAVGITAAGTLLLLGVSGRFPRAAGVTALSLVLAVASVVTAGLVVNDLHFTTDTVAGLCLAVVIVYGSALLVDHVADRDVRAV